MPYTVKQLAALAGVSVRTLHHYDEIGLLAPPVIGANGYRYYDEASLLRLQGILFYRELELPLAAIKDLLDRPGLDAVSVLREQRAALEARLGHVHQLIATIDQTIAHLSGESKMKPKQLFKAFTPEEEKKYGDEAARRWGEKTVRASQRKYAAYSAEQKARIAAEGNALYTDLLAAMPQGPAAPAVQACIGRWHRHLEYFWTPTPDALMGLATTYRDDPAFRKTYDGIDPALAPFMVEAVAVYVSGLRARSS